MKETLGVRKTFHEDFYKRPAPHNLLHSAGFLHNHYHHDDFVVKQFTKLQYFRTAHLR